MTTATAAERAAELHRQAIVIDAVCPLMRQPEHWDEWIRGGATAVCPTIASDDDPASAFAQVAKWLRWLREHADRLHHVTRAADIAEAKRLGKLGIIFHFQNTVPVADNLDLLEAYQRLGLRMIQLTYNVRNRVGDGCAERTDAGLSHFGVELVRECNRLGIVVDCTHTGRQTTLDAIRLSERPPVFSHSNALALCRNRRNLDDEQLKAVAEKHGLVGMVGFPAFVSRDPDPTVENLLDHVDYIARLIGADHIGIGLDYYGTGSPAAYAESIRRGLWRADEYPPPPHYYPKGIEDASQLPNLTAGLLRRGYSDSDVLKIMGGNWVRVFRDNWGG